MTDSTSYYPLQAENGAVASAENMQAGAKGPSHEAANTPHSNTGCTFHNPPKSLPTQLNPSSFSFDWYQATLDKEIQPMEVLRWAQVLGDSIPGRPKNGYDVAHDFGQASISYGGKTGDYGVHVKISGGDSCENLVELFRQTFPEHRPSRVDVCIDFRGPKAWDDLKDLLIRAAKKFKVKTGTSGDWLEGLNGRTLYLNPRKKGKEASAYSARLYEKGHQMRAIKHILDAPLDWVRLEFEIHPPKHTRHLLAGITPDQAARSSRWMRYICDELGTVHAERVKISTRRIKPPVVDSLEHMFSQYVGPIKEAKRDSWMDRDEWMQACADIWDREAFGGLPAEIRRNWYF